ncbi:MAG: DNA polymerase Y family protein [Acidobacteriaceae bacterium]
MKPGELYACLRAREFSAQAMLRLRPELRGKAVAVLAGEPPLEQVCSRNEAAAGMGVAAGMTRVEMETFPAIVLLRRAPAEEAAAQTALLECVGRFSPRVETVAPETEFLCVADIAGTERLFGAPRKLGQQLVQAARAAGLRANVAISSNFHAAVCAARGGTALVLVIPRGEEKSALANLPLAVLDGLSADHAETLAQWGIATLGMLAELPERELTARLGQEGARLRRMARGEAPHHFLPAETVFAPEERMELDAPVELLESLLFVLAVLLDHLLARAAARVLALASITLTCTLEDGTSYTRTVRPALPSNDKRLWLKLLHLDLEAHSCAPSRERDGDPEPQAAIVAVTMQGEPGKLGQTQLGLFSPQLPEGTRLEVTLARIRALVGEGNVGRAALQDTHAPENFRVEPFTASSSRPRIAAGSSAVQPRIALRQLRPPEASSVTVRDRQPVAFTFQAQRYAIEDAWGPWRQSGGWWAHTWDLEQWDVTARAPDGAFLCGCLAFDVRQHLWHLVALYD